MARRSARPRFCFVTEGLILFAKSEDLQKYLAALEASGFDYQMVINGGVRPSFINPNGDNLGMEALHYNPQADRRSWAPMKMFFAELFEK